MSILDVIARYRQTEAVFLDYGDRIGVCLCCEALFDSLQQVSETYRLDLETLILDLKATSDIHES
jgi:hypothetical protein